MNDTKDLNIILIDDNLDHVKIIIWALEQAEVRTKVTVIDDGEKALEYLLSNGTPAGARRPPDLVLLDINMPKVNGLDVLQKIKNDRELRRIPVVVLSSSERQEDIDKAYVLGANTFISKAAVFNEIARAMNTLCNYWSQVAELPPRTY